MTSTEESFQHLVEHFSGSAGVTPPEAHRSGFGSHALKVNGSIFAMFVRGHLVVKLPQHRVQQLIVEGTGGVFDANKGTAMKQWLTVLLDTPQTWQTLAEEALAFVGARPPPTAPPTAPRG